MVAVVVVVNHDTGNVAKHILCKFTVLAHMPSCALYVCQMCSAQCRCRVGRIWLGSLFDGRDLVRCRN